MRAVPLSPMLGAELCDFDIKKPRTGDEQAQLRSLFLEYHLLLIRGQSPDLDDHNRFTSYFGPLSAMLSNGDTAYVSNKVIAGDGAQRVGPVAVTGTENLLWHADGTYGPCPGIGTSLLAVDVSVDATPTLFANCARALMLLPSEIRARIEPLHAVHMRDTLTSKSSEPWRDHLIVPDAFDEPGRVRSQIHPIIYRGPHLDRDVLFVNFLMTSHVAELPRQIGDALLDSLYSHIYSDDNIYAHRWAPGDIVIWDNIALQHSRPENMGTAARHLRRLTIDGWTKDNGEVIEWLSTSSPRDLAKFGREREASLYG